MLSLLQGLLPLLVAHMHRVLGAEWDWSGKLGSTACAVSTVAAAVPPAPQAAAGSPGGGIALEEAREKGELQLAYYSLLHVVVHTGLSRALLELPPRALDAVVKVWVGTSPHVLYCCAWCVLAWVRASVCE